MLVPIDLHRLAARVGYLGPERALCHRLGGSLAEHLDGRGDEGRTGRCRRCAACAGLRPEWLRWH